MKENKLSKICTQIKSISNNNNSESIQNELENIIRLARSKLNDKSENDDDSDDKEMKRFAKDKKKILNVGFNLQIKIWKVDIVTD